VGHSHAKMSSMKQGSAVVRMSDMTECVRQSIAYRCEKRGGEITSVPGLPQVDVSKGSGRKLQIADLSRRYYGLLDR